MKIRARDRDIFIAQQQTTIFGLFTVQQPNSHSVLSYYNAAVL